MKKFYFLTIVVFIASCNQVNIDTPKSYYISDGTVTNVLNMDFVYIEPGSFLMGIPEGYRGSIGGENPRHKVTISEGFYIQATEVTQEQWYKVTGYNPSYFKNCGKDCPVERVSWEDVQQFISLLNDVDDTYQYRLPTEAEWEYAARANSKGPYYFGDCLTTFHANFKQRYINHENMYQCPDGSYIGHPIPVGSLERNGWGLYDMYGNVSEWCQDYFGERPLLHSSVTDPVGPEKGYARVVRGGSWESAATNCMSGYSIGTLQENRNYNTGFRLVMTEKK